MRARAHASSSRGRVRRLPGALLALAVTLLVAAPAAAQDVTGVALGPDGEPLVGVTVVLHGVGAGGGAMAGTDTTGAQGEFAFDLPDGDTNVYFAALRYEGSLYVGPAIEPGEGAVTGYVLQVEPTAEVGAVGAALSNAMAPPPQPRPASGSSNDTGALLLVALLALAAAAVFVFTAPRYRERRTREAVIEVARIENELADASRELDPEERQRLESRRDQLKEQLAPPT